MARKDPQAEMARHITEDPDVLCEDQPCPICGKQAYVGFTNIECPTRGCPNYSKKQEEIVYGKGPSQASGLWKDISDGEYYNDSGYCSANGGRVFQITFEVLKTTPGPNFKILPLPGSGASNAGQVASVTLDVRSSQIQIESRYGYVDAWLNNEFLIEKKTVFMPDFWIAKRIRRLKRQVQRTALGTNPYTPQEEATRDRIIDEMKNKIEKWLAELNAQGRISI